MHDPAATMTLVPVTELTPHPQNARRGDVSLIAESLKTHGQYRPIVVSKRTKRILAGNHTWQAAKRLGWSEILVTFVDVDEAGERRILLADNRASDLATYDDDHLAELLRSLPDLDGTGFTLNDLESLEGLFSAPTSASGGDGITPHKEIDEEIDAEVAVGSIRLLVERDAFQAWAVPIEQHALKPEVNIRRRLGLPDEPKKKKAESKRTPPFLTSIATEKVAINELNPYADNARQGDVGVISESLRINGQYRPIVVNRPDMTILVGNHTWQAAKMLGWDEIAVTFVDVTPEQALKIVLVDNRTADLATYDTDALLHLLKELPDPTGTGFDGDDLDDLLSGASGRPQKALGGPVKVRVDKWRFTVRRDLFDPWADALGPEPHTTIAERLILPPGTWRLESEKS